MKKNSIASIVLIAIALVFGGCTQSQGSPDIVIDPECPAEYVQAVIDGADAWEEALDIEYFNSIIVSDEGTNVWCSTWPEDYMYRKDEVLAATHFTWDNVQIYFNLDQNDEDVIGTATHELGHWLSGRIDHLPEGNLMARNASQQTPYITDADIEYVSVSMELN